MLYPLLVLALASPQPAGSPACAERNREARAVQLSQVEWPRGYNTTHPVDVVIELMIGTDGTITGGHVQQSSGITAFDAAAVQSAEQSKFEPKLVDCKPVVATYLFKVTFEARP